MLDDETVIGPELSALIGMAMGEVSREAAEQQRHLAGRQEQLRQLRLQIAIKHAGALAAADLTAMVLAEQKGDSPKRLGAPGARDLRNMEYATLTARHLAELTGGKIALKQLQIVNLAGQKHIR